MRDIVVNIGGEGDQTSIPLVIQGCECRTEDFLMSLIQFTNNWRAAADRVAPEQTTGHKPGGCQDAK